MPKPDKQCHGCGRSVPEQEIHPPVDELRLELRKIRTEMASAEYDAYRAFIAELSRAMVRDPKYDEISRLTSVAVFTAKQTAIGERMLSERWSEDSALRY